MITIKDDCLDNAAGMINSRHAWFLGWVGNIQYYLVDGVAWSHALEGRIARAENSEETEMIVKMVGALNRNDKK